MAASPPSPSHAHDAPRAGRRRHGSLLLASAAHRMARVSLAIGMIWLVTAWALDAWPA